jgi:predicted nucleic-acid-binding Zn-ribbon protein
MKKIGKCPKCDSTDIITNAKPIAGGSPVRIAVYRNPDALIFKEAEETTASACVCVGCGYVELYADQPRAIKLPKR